jgi:excisionase family DNA binding protein
MGHKSPASTASHLSVDQWALDAVILALWEEEFRMSTVLQQSADGFDFLTVDEVARQLRVSPQTVRYWLGAGTLRGFKVSHKVWRIQRADFQAFVIAGLRGAAPPEPTPPAAPAPHEASVSNPLQRKAALITRLQAMKAAGYSFRDIATQLNDEDVSTISGRGQWQPSTVGKLLAEARIAAEEE